MMNIFKENMINIYGSEGKVWLGSLEKRLHDICHKYQITNLSPVRNMTFNYVASGTINNKPIILKYGFNKIALKREAEALRSFSSHGGVKPIIDEPHLIIMEKALPGASLKSHYPDKDDIASKILCDLITKLHKAPIPEHHAFHQLSSLFKVIDDFEDLPTNIQAKAKKIRTALFSKTERFVLLHGDLHHENILKQEDNFVAIDPKGFIGNPVYDVTAYIINPMPELLNDSSLKHLIQNRVDVIASALNVSNKEVLHWTFLKSVKCWIWSKQDNLDDTYFKTMTYLFESLCDT